MLGGGAKEGRQYQLLKLKLAQVQRGERGEGRGEGRGERGEGRGERGEGRGEGRGERGEGRGERGEGRGERGEGRGRGEFGVAVPCANSRDFSDGALSAE